MRRFSTAGPPIMNRCIKNAEPSFCLFFSHSVLCSEVNLVLMEFGIYLFIGGNCKLLSSEILSATLTSNHDVILIFWSWLQIFTLCSNRDQELAELAAALTEVSLAGLLDLWVSNWTRVRVSQSTRLKWEKKHVWQHIAAVCGCVPLPCSHQPLRWSPSLHWPTRTARELCSGQQSKLTMTPPPPPTTDSNASRGHESSLMRSLKPEHNCEAEWPINNPIALETVHSWVNPHVSLVRRLSGGVFVSLWCPLETFLMNRYGDVLGLVSSLLLRGAFDWDSPPVVSPLEETAVQTRAVEKFTNSTRLVPWFVESALGCDFPLLCRCRACTSSQRTTACTSSQGRPKG